MGWWWEERTHLLVTLLVVQMLVHLLGLRAAYVAAHAFCLVLARVGLRSGVDVGKGRDSERSRSRGDVVEVVCVCVRVRALLRRVRIGRGWRRRVPQLLTSSSLLGCGCDWTCGGRWLEGGGGGTVELSSSFFPLVAVAKLAPRFN